MARSRWPRNDYPLRFSPESVRGGHSRPAPVIRLPGTGRPLSFNNYFGTKQMSFFNHVNGGGILPFIRRATSHATR